MKKQQLEKRGHRHRHRHGYGGMHSRGNLHNLIQTSEDILRYIRENEEERIAINQLLTLCVNPKKLGRTLCLLENYNHIVIEDGFLKLTDEGRVVAENIYQKHVAIENAFENPNSKLSSHKIAHILEHNLSECDIEKIYKYRSNCDVKSYPLTEFSLPRGTIHKVTIESEKHFYRLLALGVFPGQMVEIDCRNDINQIIRIKNARFAIDITIAKHIYVIP